MEFLLHNYNLMVTAATCEFLKLKLLNLFIELISGFLIIFFIYEKKKGCGDSEGKSKVR